MTMFQTARRAIAATALSAVAITSMAANAIDTTTGRAATPTAQQSSLGGKGSGFGIFGCSSEGGKQIPGAVIGGVLGGFLGNRIAGRNSRTLGTVLGGALGAAAGSALGCRLQQNDRLKAERAVQDAVATNQNQSWQSEETGASGTVEVASAGTGVGLGNLKLAKNVEPASGYAKLGKAFTTTASANIRSRPGLDGQIMGKLPTGTRVWVPASVSGEPWYLVSDNGVGQGYVSNALLKPAVETTAAKGCKMIKQTIAVPDEGSASETYQACKGSDGQWVMTRV
jgi:surface antigen